MALEKQTVSLAMGKGLDQKDDPKQLNADGLTILQNGVFSVGKEIKKRNGNASLSKNISGGGTISAGVNVAPYNSELAQLDGSSLYSYNSAGTNWVNKGTLVNTQLAVSSVIRTTTQQTIQDSAINGSYRCYVWYDSVGQIGYSIFDKTTGQSIVNNQTVDATGTVAKVLALGNYFVIIYYSSTGPALKYRAIDISTPTAIAAAVSISTDINATYKLFDATVFNSRIYIAYSSQANAVASLYYLDTSLVLSSKQDVGATRPQTSLTIFGDASNQAWVAWADGSNVKVTIRSANLSSQVLAPTTLEAQTPINITGLVSGTVGTLYYQIAGTASGGAQNDFIRTNTMTVAGAAGSASVFGRGMGLASKAFSFSSVTYFMIAYESNLQSTYFLINGSGNIVLKLSPSQGGGYTDFAILPEVSSITTGQYLTASLVKDLVVADSGTISAQTGVLAATMTFSTASQPLVTLGNNLITAGGIINAYDGANVNELGFNVFPEGLSSTYSTSGSGALQSSTAQTNTYQYSAVYEWTDNQGQLHRSAPSVPITLQVPQVVVVQTTGVCHGTGGTPANHFGTTVTGVPNAANYDPGLSPSGTWFMSLPTSVPNGVVFTSFGLNNPISSVSGGTITVTNAYDINGTNTLPFIISTYPLGFYADPYLGGVTQTYNIVGGSAAVGQLIYPGSGTSAYPAGTHIASITSGTYTTNNPKNGTAADSGGMATVYYSPNIFTASVTVPTLRLSGKPRVSISLYRTELNGTVFYRTKPSNQITYNTASVDSVTIVDTTADADLVGYEQLYTTGGEIENIAPPAASFIQSFKSRAVIGSPENPLSWFYSKKVVPGAPVEFTDAFFSNVDSKIGKVSAAGVMDEKIILFGPSNKYVVVGDGPAASGANNDYSEPQKITGSTGCINQSSILEIPNGLIYQDPSKGIYLLDRSLQEQFIGAQVSSYNSDPVTSAQLIPGTQSARLTLASGNVLIYDWFYNQWGADPYGTQSVAACLFGATSGVSSGTYSYVQPGGLVLQETPGTYSDNGSFYALSLTSGWISFASVQGFQRVYELLILGEYKSAHNLVVTVYTDFNDTTPVQTTTITPDSSVPYEYRVRMVQQKCTAIKISITDTNQAGTGESYSISNIAFLVGIKGGANKLPASQSY